MDWQDTMHQIVSAAVFGLAGVLIFALALWVMGKLAPFSVRKEIEEDQNTALGVVMGSALLGIAIIVAAAIHG